MVVIVVVVVAKLWVMKAKLWVVNAKSRAKAKPRLETKADLLGGKTK